jgi:hypothetical protein
MRLIRKCRRHLDTCGIPKNNCKRCWDNYYIASAPDKYNRKRIVSPEERLLAQIFGENIYV